MTLSTLYPNATANFRRRRLVLIGWICFIVLNGVLSFPVTSMSSLSSRRCHKSLTFQNQQRLNRWTFPFTAATSKSFQTRRFEDYSDYSQGYPVQVSHEGISCEIQVRRNETILAALERCGVAEQLATPLPFDCRRGNCLTCTGRLMNRSSSFSSVVTNAEVGLTPYMAQQVEEAGFVLTCSSYVTGPGVQLELGQNNHAWQQLWSRHFQTEEVQNAGRAAVARVMRFRAENHLTKWAAETERVLQQPSPDQDPSTTSSHGDWS